MSKSHEVTMANFETTVESNPIVILDFWAEWCGPCKAFAPVFEKGAEAHTDVYFGKVDTEAQTDLAGAFAIRSIPTLMAFKEGVLVFEQAGMLPAPHFEALVQHLKKLDMNEVRKQMAEDAANAENPENEGGE